MKGWEYVSSGRNRAVYRRGNYVVKVPLNEEGIHDNHHERNTFLGFRMNPSFIDHPDCIQYARCRLLGDLLVMQYAMFVGPGTSSKGYLPYSFGPSWMAFVDCGQAGYNRFGKVVAYDYGWY